jgi:hypothetical protein
LIVSLKRLRPTATRQQTTIDHQGMSGDKNVTKLDSLLASQSAAVSDIDQQPACIPLLPPFNDYNLAF